MNTRKHQTGFGLVEVLISLLIVSIGLLGIAALQVTAVRNVGSSMERSQAVIQTYSYMDILRAKRDQAVISTLDLAMSCDPEEIPESKAEQRKWVTQLHATLGPESCGQVKCLGGGKCTITVQWDDSRARGGEETQQLVTETIL
jgi:type IV pilus assembly protein PilV